jgi:hypothetical protein
LITLLEGTLAGDEDAFAELVSRYRNQITSYIYRMTNDYDGAGTWPRNLVRLTGPPDATKPRMRSLLTFIASRRIWRLANCEAQTPAAGFIDRVVGSEGEEARTLTPDERPLQDTSLVDRKHDEW